MATLRTILLTLEWMIVAFQFGLMAYEPTRFKAIVTAITVAYVALLTFVVR